MHVEFVEAVEKLIETLRRHRVHVAVVSLAVVSVAIVSVE
jgi:uncharacterized protein involved in exopolysaccharide biosynthesis